MSEDTEANNTFTSDIVMDKIVEVFFGVTVPDTFDSAGYLALKFLVSDVDLYSRFQEFLLSDENYGFEGAAPTAEATRSLMSKIAKLKPVLRNYA